MSSLIGYKEIFNATNRIDIFMKRNYNGTDHLRLIAKGNIFDGKKAIY